MVRDLGDQGYRIEAIRRDDVSSINDKFVKIFVDTGRLGSFRKLTDTERRLLYARRSCT